jgi:signal transduction histidine kinase
MTDQFDRTAASVFTVEYMGAFLTAAFEAGSDAAIYEEAFRALHELCGVRATIVDTIVGTSSGRHAPIKVFGSTSAWIHTDSSESKNTSVDLQSVLDLVANVIGCAQAKNRSQYELLRAQKLSDVGSMSFGIFHEIATPLQFTQNNLQFFDQAIHELTKVPDPRGNEGIYAEMGEAAKKSLYGLHKVAEIVAAVKELGHEQHDVWSTVDINQILHNVVLLTNHLAEGTCELSLDLAIEVPAVTGDTGQLNQAFLNLVTNAIYAATHDQETSGRRPTVCIATYLRDESVVVEIRDSGNGIPEAVAGRIWESFFTTKDPGDGTGLGLAIVRSIVASHRGHISFDSSSNGTTFTVELPI